MLGLSDLEELVTTIPCARCATTQLLFRACAGLAWEICILFRHFILEQAFSEHWLGHRMTVLYACNLKFYQQAGRSLGVKCGVRFHNL